MKVTFRTLAIGVAAVGLGLGASFGAGVAYGRADPKTVSAGLTPQQISSLLGIAVPQGTASSSGGPSPGAGAARQQGQGSGAAGAIQSLTRSASGKITAIEGGTITIETRTGVQKINIGAGASIEKMASGSISDLKVGDTIVAGGSRNDDGSFEATSVSPVPRELQALITGGGEQQAPGGR